MVAAITPFNFPLILSSTKIAAALAAGNVVVHKPADDTPLSALFMAELLHDAGVPDGVLNVVTGSGPVVGEALLRHPGVDKIAFTGSTAIGRHAASVAGEHLKPVTMELGGNAAHIVFDDADLDVGHRRGDQGVRLQHRPVLHGRPAPAGRPPAPRHRRSGILAQAVPDGADRRPARRRRPSSARWPASGSCAKVEEYVELARKEGGRIVCGGERLDLDGGYYYRPTVIADLPADSRVIAGGGLRAGAHRAALRHRGRGRRAGQRHAVRPRRRAADPRRRPRAPGRGPPRRRHRLGQRLGDARPRRPLRWRQGLRLRPRVRPRGARGLHQGQVRRRLPSA